jgi:hypothetical protein
VDREGVGGSVRRCANPQCGKELVRKAYESGLFEQPSSFDRRRFCDLPCRDARRDEERYCAHCNKLLRRRKNENHCRFKIRMFCDNGVCKHRPPVDVVRACEQCGKRLKRRVGTETKYSFARRRYCNRKCAKNTPEIKIKTCLQCQQTFTRYEGEGVRKYIKRRFCSSKCGATKTRSLFGQPTSTAELASLVGCTYACAAKRLQTQTPEQLLAGAARPKTARRGD